VDRGPNSGSRHFPRVLDLVLRQVSHGTQRGGRLWQNRLNYFS
jgi:hypothetical protein